MSGMKRKTAFKIAVASIEYKQREFVVGYNALIAMGGGPASLYFTKRDHKWYERLEDAKRILEAAAAAEGK